MQLPFSMKIFVVVVDAQSFTVSLASCYLMQMCSSY